MQSGYLKTMIDQLSVESTHVDSPSSNEYLARHLSPHFIWTTWYLNHEKRPNGIWYFRIASISCQILKSNRYSFNWKYDHSLSEKNRNKIENCMNDEIVYQSVFFREEDFRSMKRFIADSALEKYSSLRCSGRGNDHFVMVLLVEDQEVINTYNWNASILLSGVDLKAFPKVYWQQSSRTVIDGIAASSDRNSCFTCHNTLEKPLICAKCRLISYCSISCQKAEWKRHRPKCAAITKNKTVSELAHH